MLGAPNGGFTPFGGVLTLSFAPGPTFTQGKCPKGYHWQFNPTNDGSGACYLTGPPPKP